MMMTVLLMIMMIMMMSGHRYHHDHDQVEDFDNSGHADERQMKMKKARQQSFDLNPTLAVR